MKCSLFFSIFIFLYLKWLIIRVDVKSSRNIRKMLADIEILRTFATAIEKQTMFQEMPRWRNR
mgnify:CR=1 FL=1